MSTAKVPDAPLGHPWESCLTMGTSWSYKPRDTYKSTRELVHLLINVVAKSGNLLLNVGPTPEGDFPAEASEHAWVIKIQGATS
ncbi:MAG TPA: alpha-L-fucosidase [Armatimonadota bacterium]